jgi:integrase/recombinase XerD
VTLAWMPRDVDSSALEGQGFELTRLGMPLADYLAAKEVAGRVSRTLRDKRAYLGGFALMWPNVELVDIESRHVLHYLAHHQKRGLTLASLRIRYTHLNDFFEWAVAWDLIEKNPMRRLDTPRRPGKRVYDIFSPAEVKALEALPLIDGALLSIMLEAGLRKGECCRLRVRDIRGPGEHGGFGELVILNGKGAKDRTVQMNRRLANTLAMLRLEVGLDDRDYLWYRRVNQGRTIKRERPIGDGSFTRWWDRVFADSGVRRRNPHMARHTFATNWLRAGGRLETLSLEMGHESIQTTKDLYGHLDSRDAIRDILLMEAVE